MLGKLFVMKLTVSITIALLSRVLIVVARDMRTGNSPTEMFFGSARNQRYDDENFTLEDVQSKYFRRLLAKYALAFQMSDSALEFPLEDIPFTVSFENLLTTIESINAVLTHDPEDFHEAAMYQDLYDLDLALGELLDSVQELETENRPKTMKLSIWQRFISKLHAWDWWLAPLCCVLIGSGVIFLGLSPLKVSLVLFLHLVAWQWSAQLYYHKVEKQLQACQVFERKQGLHLILANFIQDHFLNYTIQECRTIMKFSVDVPLLAITPYDSLLEIITRTIFEPFGKFGGAIGIFFEGLLTKLPFMSAWIVVPSLVILFGITLAAVMRGSIALPTGFLVCFDKAPLVNELDQLRLIMTHFVDVANRLVDHLDQFVNAGPNVPDQHEVVVYEIEGS